jgi:hypothetical protein
MVEESVFIERRGGQMQTSSEYLTLALDVRNLTDSLVRLVEEDVTPSDELNSSIQKVVNSLRGTGKTSVKSLRERGPFGRYASVRAMSEVFGEEQRKTLIRKLITVINPQSREERTESALAAIPFFDALERRALYHHNRAQVAKRYATAQ